MKILHAFIKMHPSDVWHGLDFFYEGLSSSLGSACISQLVPGHIHVE